MGRKTVSLFNDRRTVAYFQTVVKRKLSDIPQKQLHFFGEILENFGIYPDSAKVNLFTNLSLTVMVIRRAIPNTLPLLIPEAVDETIDFQINAIVDAFRHIYPLLTVLNAPEYSF